MLVSIMGKSVQHRFLQFLLCMQPHPHPELSFCEGDLNERNLRYPFKLKQSLVISTGDTYLYVICIIQLYSIPSKVVIILRRKETLFP